MILKKKERKEKKKNKEKKNGRLLKNVHIAVLQEPMVKGLQIQCIIL